MSTTESALPATTETAVSTTPELDHTATIDAALLALFPEEQADGAAPTTPETAAAAAAPETATAPETAEGDDAILDHAALEALDTPEAATPGTAGTPPVSDPFIEKLKVAIPNDVALNYAVNAFEAQTAFERAIDGGNLADAVKAMPAAGKLFKAGLAQVMANPDFERQIVENFVRRNSPENQNPQVDALRAEIETLRGRFQTEDQRAAEQQRQATARQQADAGKAAVGRIDSEVTSLFAKVRFTKNEASRNIVTALFQVALAKNPDAMAKALAGDMSAIRPIFAGVAKNYADGEKAKGIRVGSTKNTPAPILTGAGPAADSSTLKGMDKALADAANWVANNPRK